MLSHQQIRASDLWVQLQGANAAIRQAQIGEALMMYQGVLEERIERYFPPSPLAWSFYADTEQPSLTYACIYLFEYYIVRRGAWRHWLEMAQAVFRHPDFKRLPTVCRSRLICGSGWAEMYFSKKSLSHLAGIQHRALSLPGLTDFDRGLHHHVLAYISQQMRNPAKTFYHLQQASDLLGAETEPFHSLRLRESWGSTYFFLNNFDPSYYEKSIEIYQAIKTEMKEQPIEVSRQCYNLGWAYAEMGRLEAAQVQFQEGYHIMRRALRTSSLSEWNAYCHYEMALHD